MRNKNLPAIPNFASTSALVGTRLLFVIWDGGGNVGTSLLFVRDWIARGAQVSVLSNPSVSLRAKKVGATFYEFQHSPKHDPRSREGDVLKIDEALSAGHASKLLRERVMFGPASHMCKDVIETSRYVNPDLIIADYMLPGALLGAEFLRLPRVVFMNAIYPFLTGESVRNEIRNGPFVLLFERMIQESLPILNEARSIWNLEPVKQSRDLYSRAEIAMVATFPAADASSTRVPRRVHYVGGGFDLPPRMSLTTGRHVVLVSLSTTLHSARPALVATLLEAAAAIDADFHFIGGQAHDHNLPPNVRSSDFVPIEELLPSTSVLVTVGGHGTFIRGLAYGVPMLVLPVEQDAFNNARRAVDLGVGLTLRWDAPQRDVRAAIESLFQKQFRSTALRVANHIKNDYSSGASAQILSRLTT